MNIEIKGQCEYCGTFFIGKISQGLVDKYDGSLPCKCGKLTQNWDESYIVDVLNREENLTPEYAEFVFA